MAQPLSIRTEYYIQPVYNRKRNVLWPLEVLPVLPLVPVALAQSVGPSSTTP